jgi:methyl-accepting chemotaxis protein
MLKLDNQTILLAFAIVTGLAVLLQAMILLAIFVTMRKASGSIREEAANLRSSLMPVLLDTQDVIASSRDTLAKAQEFLVSAQGVLNRVSPKIEAAAGDLEEIAHGLRAQTAQVQSSAMEILEQVRKQSNRLDHMITSLLDTVDRAGGFVTDLVSRPVRQISGILAMVKAVVESLRGPAPQRRSIQPPAGDDRFV